MSSNYNLDKTDQPLFTQIKGYTVMDNKTTYDDKVANIKINTCLGKILADLNCILHCYNCVKKTIGHTIEILNNLETEIENMLSETISNEIRDSYFCSIKDLRDQINNQTIKKTVCGQICIPQEEETLIFNCGGKDICFKLPPFLSMHFLQSTDINDEYLFFKESPESVPYEQNIKLTINQIPNGSILYPVWYYMLDNKISTNYTYLISILNNEITYSELLDYRLLLKDDIKMKCKKSVEACGKYKFHFMKDCKICLPNPKNINETLSPKKQGVIDGLYSFAESIDCYTNKPEALVAIDNTKIVLKKLEDLLCILVNNMIDLKSKFCCGC